jgi:tetratricopeptide (TPR) repeat protein
MTADRWERIKAVFDSALGISQSDRASFLDRECEGDPDLRREIDRLLVEFEQTESCLDEPVAHLNHTFAPDDVAAGRYRIVRLLGRGGMGEVYEAVDQLLNESIALKTLRADLSYDQSMARRFQSEIQLARKVTHPNVCRVFEVGVHEHAGESGAPLHFFTMQLLEGETLAARIRRAGRLPATEAFPFIAQMAEGLHAAHRAGIIHRDFKSANVMISGGCAVITDFGLAGLQRGRSEAVSTGSVSSGARIAGTVAYMSPEQMMGERITPASDIYSLGIVLFEMATGRLPFEEGHIIQSAVQRVRGQPLPLRESAPDIDPRWEFAIRRCMAVEPDKRFSSASEVAGLFHEHGWRPPPLYWSRRKWVKVAAMSGLPVATGCGLWLWSRRPYVPKPQALVWYQRGVEALRSATAQAARRDLEKAVETDPHYAPAYACLAAAYGDLDASERAEETMLKAVSVAQDERLSQADAVRVKALQYVIARDFDRARPLFEQLVSAAPERGKAGAYVDLAWLAWKRQDTPGMIPPLQQASRIDPTHAGAKLWMAFAVDRQGKKDAAQRLFAEAESLFQSASDYDGVVETLLQRAISLGRTNRAAEALTLANRGMAVATSTGDLHHEIQLQLALALAYRTLGQTSRSQQVAEAAVKMAVENKMDQPAAIGLLDLGNAYFQRDEPEESERYFLQGLEFATRGRALFSEARARLSLASLSDKYDRPGDVAQYLQPALAFFRGAGYRREAMQASLLLGGAQESLAQFEEAEKTQRAAIRLAEQLHDAEQTGLAHLYLSSVMAKSGRWPESLAEKNQALAIFGDMRGGYRAAYTLLARGRLQAQMGRFDEAAVDLAQARAKVEKLEGKQAQLRARLELGSAEIASYQTNWAAAQLFARKAAASDGGIVENIESEMLAGLAMIQTGPVQPGLAACRRAILASEEKSQPYLAARGKLRLAEALFGSHRAGDAESFAQAALAFFEPRRNWEAVWRCHRLLATDDHARLARAALEEGKRLWPDDVIGPYLQRPDIRMLALP